MTAAAWRLMQHSGFNSAINKTFASGNTFDAQSIMQNAFNASITLSPTATPVQQSSSAAATNPPAAKKFGYAILAVVIIVALFVLWRLIVWYKRKREQQRMALESARADSVLGDMAMVPQHDDDDDGELL